MVSVFFSAGLLTSTPTPTLNLPLIIMQKQLLLCDKNDVIGLLICACSSRSCIPSSLNQKNSLISPSKIRWIKIIIYLFIYFLSFFLYLFMYFLLYFDFGLKIETLDMGMRFVFMLLNEQPINVPLLQIVKILQQLLQRITVPADIIRDTLCPSRLLWISLIKRRLW